MRNNELQKQYEEDAKNVKELEAQLRQALEKHQEDMRNNPQAALARARELADLVDRVERAKRQRTGAGS